MLPAWLANTGCGDVRISYGDEVRVETAGGEVLEWSRIRVSGDRCGPFTVVLQAEISIVD